MSERQQQLQRLVDDAEDLVGSIETLRTAAGSYRDASDELDDVAKRLTDLADRTQELAESSHQLLQATTEIGAGGIQESLGEIASRLNATHELAEKTVTAQQATRDEIENKADGIADALSQIGSQSEGINKQLQDDVAAEFESIEKSLREIDVKCSSAAEAGEVLDDKVVPALADLKEIAASTHQLLDEGITPSLSNLSEAVEEANAKTTVTQIMVGVGMVLILGLQLMSIFVW